MYMKEFKLLGKRLLVVVAHPDDESFGCAGTLRENRKAGGENAVLCATKGENGKSHLAKPVSSARLKAIRAREFKNVMADLRIKKFRLLDLPDGKVKRDREKFHAEILRFAKRYRPDVIVSFGPDGMSGHLDHIAAGMAARKAARELRVPFVAFAASPLIAKHFGRLKKRRKFGVYAKKTVHAAPNLKIKINLKAKFKVLRNHRSQMDGRSPFSSFPRKEVEKILSYEYFRA